MPECSACTSGSRAVQDHVFVFDNAGNGDEELCHANAFNIVLLLFDRVS
jgi:hypothetical protein